MEASPRPRLSPDPLRLPVEKGQIEAARETLRDNKGAQWSVCFAIGIQVGGDGELRDNLVALLVEFDMPMATISDAFGLSGREVWAIAASEPISVFWCVDCESYWKFATGETSCAYVLLYGLSLKPAPETQGSRPCCVTPARTSGSDSVVRSND